MSAADFYRRIAAELRAKAAFAPSAILAVEWYHLAEGYLRLAEQADSNSHLNMSFEFGPKVRLDGEGDGT